MNGNKWVRQIHRWLSLAFTVAVVVNIVERGRQPPVWVYLLALVALGLLLLTGLYLFILPYLSRSRSGRRAGRVTPVLE